MDVIEINEGRRHAGGGCLNGDGAGGRDAASIRMAARSPSAIAWRVGNRIELPPCVVARHERSVMS